MPLKPYHNAQEAHEIANRFNPCADEYISATSAYSAAILYFKKYGGEIAVNIFENIIRKKYHGPISEEHLPQIAKEMYELAIFIEPSIKKQWVSHLTQIKNARMGSGNPLKGYIHSFDPSYA